jgi:hypothetical protein
MRPLSSSFEACSSSLESESLKDDQISEKQTDCHTRRRLIIRKVTLADGLRDEGPMFRFANVKLLLNGLDLKITDKSQTAK